MDGSGREGRAPEGAYLLLVVAPLLWSGNFLAGRLLAGSLPPVTLSLARWLVATPVLLALARRQGLGLPPRSARPVLAWMGLSGVALFTPAVYLALHTTAVFRATLLQSTTPVFGLLLAALAGMRPGWRQVAGALATVAGVAMILLAPAGGRGGGGPGGVRAGDVLMLLAALFWAVYTLGAERAAGTWRAALRARGEGGEAGVALGVTAWSALAGLPPLALLTALEWLAGGAWKAAYGAGPRLVVGAPALAGVLYVALGASVLATWAWNGGVGRIGSARAISFNNLLPVFSALWGSLLLHERPDGWSLGGGLLVVGGVSLAARGGAAGARSATGAPAAGAAGEGLPAPEPGKEA
ncbi:MAG: DMT family transporter [Firmicutes bacterium]|nr:DMT family transporter [Bacillota bacterium]